MKKPISITKHIYLLIILTATTNNLHAQQHLGAKLTALGMSGAAIKDIWNVEGNVAGISGITSPQFAINYTKYPNDADWSNQAAAFVLPIQKNYLGLSFQRFGINEYNVIKVGFAVAKKFGSELALAIKLNYHQLQIKGYGNSTALSVDVGAIYDFNEELSFGIYLHNPSFEKFNNKTIQIEIRTIISIGAAYQLSDKFLVATAIRKDAKSALMTSFGVDYQLLKQISFSGGLKTQPFNEYCGFGINYKNIVLDFAVESDSNIGLIPQIGFAYAF